MSKTYTFKYGELNRLRTQFYEVIEKSREKTFQEQYLKLLNADPDDQLDIIQKCIDINKKYDAAKEQVTDLLRMRELDNQHKERVSKCDDWVDALCDDWVDAFFKHGD